MESDHFSADLYILRKCSVPETPSPYRTPSYEPTDEQIPEMLFIIHGRCKCGHSHLAEYITANELLKHETR